jgi:hypothetical protein
VPEILIGFGPALSKLTDSAAAPPTSTTHNSSAAFRVQYGDDSATMDIDTMRITDGYLPPRVLGLVTEWGVRHRALLRENFRRVLEHRAPELIPPLE